MQIILSATIRPPVNMRAVHLVDPVARERQYRSALLYWARVGRQLDAGLILVENSGFPVADLVRGLPKDLRNQVRFLESAATPADINVRGKGAAEALMLDQAIRSLGLTDPLEFVYKVTGRLTVSNATRILMPADGPSVRARIAVDMSMVDARLFGASYGIWTRELAGMHQDVDEQSGIYLEHVVMRRLMGALAKGRTQLVRFERPPLYVGVSGSSGTRYGGLRQRLASPASRVIEWALRGPLQKKMF